MLTVDLIAQFISFRYPDSDTDVFRDFSASFPLNKRTAVLAKSGNGKTTLMHLLAGLIKPTEGEIHYPASMGKNPSFSMVFQENIVRALLADYDVLLLDEPFTSLDGETKNVMMKLVNDYTKGKTMILVTHNESEAEFFACEIMRL